METDKAAPTGGLPRWLSGKESTCQTGDSGHTSSILASGRSSGGWNGNPLQYSCLRNPVDRGASQSAVYGVARVRHDLATKQFSSVAQVCPSLCGPMDCSTPGLPVHHQVPEPTQTHVHWVGDAIQPSHPLSSPSPPAFNLFKHQGLFQWVSSSHQVAKVLELQLQHQSFQWIFRVDFL